MTIGACLPPVVLLPSGIPDRDMPGTYTYTAFPGPVPPPPTICSLTSAYGIGVYASANAFVLPSRGEGWGRPHVEASMRSLTCFWLSPIYCLTCCATTICCDSVHGITWYSIL
jgi:glycosyltransferase involved in cell wall biosynthesis